MRYTFTAIRLVLIIGMLMMSGYLWVRYQNTTGTSLSDAITEVLVSCRDQHIRAACIKAKITPLVRKYNQSEILPALELAFREREYAGEAGWVSCHDLAHLVGEAEVEKGTPIGSVVVSCSSACGFGCTHGALFAYMKRQRFDRKSIPGVCASLKHGYPPQTYDACIHGLGHAMAELASYTVNTALDYCGELGDVPDSERCAAGVFMEMIGTDSEPGPVAYAGMQSFCKDVPGTYASVCAKQTGENSISRLRDEQQALRECMAVEQKDRPDCLVSLANMYYFQVDGDAGRIFEFCAGLRPELVDSCIRGSIQSDVITNAKADHSIALCTLLTGNQRSLCFSELGQKVAYVYGTDLRQPFCAALPAGDMASCLK